MAAFPAAAAAAVVGNGLSPIWSSITSLPAALSRFATARTSKAVSAVSPRANDESDGPGPVVVMAVLRGRN